MSQSRVRQVSAPIAINLVTPAKELNHDAQFPNLRFEVEAPKAKKTRGNERASKLDYDEQASKQASKQAFSLFIRTNLGLGFALEYSWELGSA